MKSNLPLKLGQTTVDLSASGDLGTHLTLRLDALEHELIPRSTLGLRFFGLGELMEVTEYPQDVKASDSGNGLYQVQAKTGVTQESGQVGRTGEFQVTASGSERVGARTVLDLDFKAKVCPIGDQLT
jgi:hypothetical protein